MLRRRHTAAHQLRRSFPCKDLENVFAIVEVEDHPVRCAERASHRRQYGFRNAAPVVGRRRRTGSRPHDPASTSAALEILVDASDRGRQTRVTLLRVVSPDHEPMMREGESDRARRNPSGDSAHRPRERETGANVGDVDDLFLEQLRHQALGRRIVDVRHAHRRHIVRMGDDTVRQERVERRLDTGRRAIAHHAAGHEPHHLRVGQ